MTRLDLGEAGTVTLEGSAVHVDGSVPLRKALDRLRETGLAFRRGGEEDGVFVDEMASVPVSEETAGLLIETLERLGYGVVPATP